MKRLGRSPRVLDVGAGRGEAKRFVDALAGPGEWTAAQGPLLVLLHGLAAAVPPPVPGGAPLGLPPPLRAPPAPSGGLALVLPRFHVAGRPLPRAHRRGQRAPLQGRPPLARCRPYLI